jgi:hypothetical protein
MNSFETILMILYYLVPLGTSPKLDIFEIQYNTIICTFDILYTFKGMKMFIPNGLVLKIEEMATIYLVSLLKGTF